MLKIDRLCDSLEHLLNGSLNNSTRHPCDSREYVLTGVSRKDRFPLAESLVLQRYYGHSREIIRHRSNFKARPRQLYHNEPTYLVSDGRGVYCSVLHFFDDTLDTLDTRTQCSSSQQIRHYSPG
jgi:hypothetical protein